LWWEGIQAALSRSCRWCGEGGRCSIARLPTAGCTYRSPRLAAWPRAGRAAPRWGDNLDLKRGAAEREGAVARTHRDPVVLKFPVVTSYQKPGKSPDLSTEINVKTQYSCFFPWFQPYHSARTLQPLWSCPAWVDASVLEEPTHPLGFHEATSAPCSLWGKFSLPMHHGNVGRVQSPCCPAVWPLLKPLWGPVDSEMKPRPLVWSWHDLGADKRQGQMPGTWAAPARQLQWGRGGGN